MLMNKPNKAVLPCIVTAAAVLGGCAGYLLTHKNMNGEDWADIAAYQAAHPSKTVTYTIQLDKKLKLKHNSKQAVITDGAQIVPLTDYADYLQQLEVIDLSSITPAPAELAALQQAFPNAQVRFSSVQILDKTFTADTTQADFVNLTDSQAVEAAQALACLPALERVSFSSNGTVFSADTAAAVAAALPHAAVDISFDLFGQTVSTDMERIEYFQAEIGGDAGLDVIRSIMPIMDKLNYLKLDWCGTSDEATAALRDELADRCKVVWRVFLTDEFNALTDTYKIWAQFQLWGDDVECLKYCTEVRYIDLGHSYVDNCEFVRYMPYLDTLILADSRLVDLEPLRTCENLTYLEVFSSWVKDLRPLADLEQLQYLNISNCKFDDITPLYGLDNLIIVNCTMADIPQDQIDKFKELHPDTKCTFNWYQSPTEYGWRRGPTPDGYRNTPRYALLREQIGYDTKDYSRYPTGYLTEEITYESTGIVPAEERDYEVYPK